MKYSKKHIYAILGVGSGAHVMDQDELRKLWETYSDEVTRYWLKNYGQLPSCTMIAERHGWPIPKIES